MRPKLELNPRIIENINEDKPISYYYQTNKKPPSRQTSVTKSHKTSNKEDETKKEFKGSFQNSNKKKNTSNVRKASRNRSPILPKNYNSDYSRDSMGNVKVNVVENETPTVSADDSPKAASKARHRRLHSGGYKDP